MSVSIKVAIRCRPFTVDDKLGVKMRQTDEEAGEVELINCEYTTKRFPFTYSWWSAYGYKRHLIGETDGPFTPLFFARVMRYYMILIWIKFYQYSVR